MARGEKVRVQTARRTGWFPVYKADLATLAAGCERRRLVFARSVLIALAEAANDDRDDSCLLTRKELAERAGVGNRAFDPAVQALVEAGLLGVESGKASGGPNLWTLYPAEDEVYANAETPSTRTRAGGLRERGYPLVTSEEEKKEEGTDGDGQTTLGVDDALPRRLRNWYVVRLTERRRGIAPSVPKAWDAAARKLAVRPPQEIKAVVEWAFTRGDYWFSRTNTLPKLARNYADALGAMDSDRDRREAVSRTNGREGHEVPSFERGMEIAR